MLNTEVRTTPWLATESFRANVPGVLFRTLLKIKVEQANSCHNPALPSRVDGNLGASPVTERSTNPDGPGFQQRPSVPLQRSVELKLKDRFLMKERKWGPQPPRPASP